MYAPIEPDASPAEANESQASRGNAREILADLVRRELLRPAPEAIAPLVAEIQRRHGDAIAAIVLYGSCLRTGHYDTGVVDFYVMVDRYRDVHRSRVAMLANALLPPSVYYMETPGPSGTLRCKYAILSRRQFLSGARLDCPSSVVWARFCQPAILVYTRDAEAVTTMVEVATQSTLTMVQVAATLPPDEGERTSIGLEELWQGGLAATYGAELRVESADVVRGLYTDARDRYDRAAALAVQVLVDQGTLQDGRVSDAGLDLVIAPTTRRAIRRRWALRRRIGKPLAGARLIKSFWTFGEQSVLYGIKKLERHTGIHIELTDFQRRWFWIACWPTIARLLVRRALR